MADFERDYIIRMIRDMGRFISMLVLGRAEPMVTLPEEDEVHAADLPPHVILYAEIIRLADAGDINAAEDMLFERLDENDLGFLEAGLAFFRHLNEMSDETLERCDFSREEIADGLRDLSDRFGVVGLE